MKAFITLMTMVFAFAAAAQTNTQSAGRGERRITPGIRTPRTSPYIRAFDCFFVEKTSGRVPQNSILYPENPESQVLFPPPPYTNGVYVYKKIITIPTTNVVVVGRMAVTNVSIYTDFSGIFYEGTNRFECKGSMLYVCGDEFVQLAKTNIVIKQTEDLSSVVQPGTVYDTPRIIRPSRLLTEEQKKEQAERERLALLKSQERWDSLKEYKANTNLLSAQELEAKGIKIMFREVLSIEMIEVDGHLRPMIIRRWIPCSEPIGKPIGRLATS